MFLSRLFFVLAAVVPANFATAHEFWLESPQYQVAPGTEMTTQLRNGQEFEGVNLAFFKTQTARFETFFDGKATKVEARSGDTPALTMTAPGTDGLLTILHEANPATVIYKDWDTFVRFTEHKDFADAPARHVAAGFTKDRVKESYTRHSKALVAIGSGTGADSFRGMETELVAITNPYAADFGGQMEVALSYEGTPRVDAQIEVYQRDADQNVEVTKHRTDDKGHARFPVTAGMTYLVDAVVLRPAPGAGSDANAAMWETLWASLTFAVPQ